MEELPVDVESVAGDAVDYMCDTLGRGMDPDWIVPAVPVHVLWEFVRNRLRDAVTLEALPPDPELTDTLPNVMTGEGHAIYTSIADFLCPDNCHEPADCCTYTGEPRPLDMHATLTNVGSGQFAPVVVQSRQLAPGVGGYRPAALEDSVLEVKSAARRILLATVCRCHAVLHLVGRAPNS
jgi:hypothetical protein